MLRVCYFAVADCSGSLSTNLFSKHQHKFISLFRIFRGTGLFLLDSSFMLMQSSVHSKGQPLHSVNTSEDKSTCSIRRPCFKL